MKGMQKRVLPLCPPSPAVARPQEPLDASTHARTRRGRHDHHRRHVRRRPLEDCVVEEARDGRLLLQAAGHPRRLRHGARRVSASSTGSAADRQAAGRRHVVQAAEGIANIDPNAQKDAKCRLCCVPFILVVGGSDPRGWVPCRRGQTSSLVSPQRHMRRSLSRAAPPRGTVGGAHSRAARALTS